MSLPLRIGGFYLSKRCTYNWKIQNLLESKQCSTFATDMRIAMRLALPSCLDSPLLFSWEGGDEIGRRWAGEAPQK